MKDDEKQYFIELWNLRKDRRKFLDYTFSKSNSKRFMYILDKWDKKGFWDYGVSLRGGWFIERNIPKRYLDLIEVKENGKQEEDN